MIINTIKQTGTVLQSDDNRLSPQYSENLQIHVVYDDTYSGWSVKWDAIGCREKKRIPLSYDSGTQCIMLNKQCFIDEYLYLACTFVKDGMVVNTEPIEFYIPNSVNHDLDTLPEYPGLYDEMNELFKQIFANEYKQPLDDLFEKNEVLQDKITKTEEVVNKTLSDVNEAIEQSSEAAQNANTAASEANEAAQAASTAKANADAATQSANTAASNANTAAQNANDIADEIERKLNAGEFVGGVGPVGPKGDKGDDGATGLTGPKGDAGTNGLTPTIGSNGNWFLGSTDTNKPSRGATGPTGATGPAGPKGAPGSVLRFGSTVPASSLGSMGDWYYNTGSELWDVYYKSTSTQWTKIGSLKSNAFGNITTGGIVASGSVKANSGFYIPNAKGYYGADTAGTNRELLSISSSNNVTVGYGATGHTNIYSASSVVVLNNEVSSQGLLDLGNGYNSSYSSAIRSYWKDGSAHNILERGANGLLCAIGWAGSSSYATETMMRGRTCKYQNASGTTSLSDRNLKKDIVDLTSDKYDVFFDNLKPREYKYILGSSGRPHFGYITQEVEEALTAAGLTTKDFAGVNIMPIHCREQETDENGNKYDIEDSPDNYLLDKNIHEQHNLIYTEFIALNTMQIQKLKTKVERLEEIIKNGL